MSLARDLLPWAVAAWLLAIGLFGVVTSRNYIHLIGCLSVVQASTYVLLLSIGYRNGAGPPIFYSHPSPAAGGPPAVDPVMQALVLTDIVIGATVTALLLALVLQLHKRRGVIDPGKLRPLNR